MHYAEREKFCRNDHTDKRSNTNEIIGKILQTDSALIPITVTEFGQFGSLFEIYLFGKEAMATTFF